MLSQPKPILFLAFANDPAHPLPRLADELRGVRAALAPALDAGLCELVEEPYATAEGILTAFRRQRDRIAIFHFAGHAGSDRLLLEAAGGGGQAADATGFAAFLAQQRGLALVFLNGCSTRDQAQGLLDAGVATVIATSQVISDDVAAEFACQFYAGLAAGRSLRAAFDQAEGALRITRGRDLRDLFDEDTGDVASGRQPWKLYERADDAAGWSLPVAANAPLFGLPALPPLDLPDKPYRYLDWYRREDAWIFFGRDRKIRELYDRVTAADGPPIVLFYGQSGVGKSSLLAAGLLPRLEGSHKFRYMRRDQAGGMLGAFTVALGVNPQAEDLAAAWREVETQARRPLLVVLDQVEEVYTRPNPQQPDELATFLAALAHLFADAGQRPQGRLILSFRKEWLAEINQRLAERKLPRGEVFLERLDRQGIEEVVSGPYHSPRLRQHYDLTVASELPATIAGDLLEDAGAAVAPTLQILLTKMWEQAKARDYDCPAFDLASYQELKRKGLLLQDFLDQQLRELHDVQPAAVSSGLALDLLAFHTTPLGTAEQRTHAELMEAYWHQAAVLPTLLRELQDRHLLVDPARNQPDQPPATRLAHDTLAPLVRRRFDDSEAPGQRARRILESRAADWRNGKIGPALEGPDLAAVEAGRDGTRAWNPEKGEMRMVEASRQALTRQRRRYIAGIALLVALLAVTVRLIWPQIVSYKVRQEVSGLSRTLPVGDTFELDQYEVSVLLYKKCDDLGPCESPSPYDDYSDPALADMPVVNLDAAKAAAFCRWLGRRLPTAAEWRQAVEQWNQDPIPTDGRFAQRPEVNMNRPGASLWPVQMGQDPSGPPRVQHLIGNAWEWTSTQDSGEPWTGESDWVQLQRVGGGFKTPLLDLTDSWPAPPSEPDMETGFRCASDGRTE